MMSSTTNWKLILGIFVMASWVGNAAAAVVSSQVVLGNSAYELALDHRANGLVTVARVTAPLTIPNGSVSNALIEVVDHNDNRESLKINVVNRFTQVSDQNLLSSITAGFAELGSLPVNIRSGGRVALVTDTVPIPADNKDVALSVNVADTDGNTLVVSGKQASDYISDFTLLSIAQVQAGFTDLVNLAEQTLDYASPSVHIYDGQLSLEGLSEGVHQYQILSTDSVGTSASVLGQELVHSNGSNFELFSTSKVSYTWGRDVSAGSLTLEKSDTSPILYRAELALPSKIIPSLQYFSYQASDELGNASETFTQTMVLIDSDDDGVPDNDDAFPENPVEQYDTDGDGVGNNEDIDDDNDGRSDKVDVFPLDPLEYVDTDGDGIGNNADLDDDGDGLSDEVELLAGLAPLVSNVGVDTDGDGLDDISEMALQTNPRVADSDGDGLLDGDEVAAGLDPLKVNETVIEDIVLAPNQTGFRVPVGQSLRIDWTLDTSDNSTLIEALTLRIYFDNYVLGFEEIADALASGYQLASGVRPDSANGDGDDSTNSYVEVQWQGDAADWLGAVPAALMSARFKLIKQDIGDFETSNVNVVMEGNPSRIDLELGKTIQYKLSSSSISVGKGAANVFTTLTMGLTSSSVIFGGNTDVSLKLSNPADAKADLSGAEVYLEVTDPDGDGYYLGPYTTNKVGQVVVPNLGSGSEFAFDKKGGWTITARFPGDAAYLEANSRSELVLVGASAGYAVIVEGKIANGEGLESHNKSANRVYRSLLERGFEDKHIFYFNHDVTQDANRDGYADDDAIFSSGVGVDYLPVKTNVQNVIEGLAPLVNGNPAPIYVIMLDHGASDGRFMLNPNEAITPTELDSWWDVLESRLSAEALKEPRVNILGYCYSGSFIEALSAPGRMTIASAAANEESYKGAMESDNVRVGEYFVEELFKELVKGETFDKAYTAANSLTETYTRRAGSHSANGVRNKYFDNAAQHPLLDDNGDSVGSNDLDAASGDGSSIAAGLILGTGPNYSVNSLINPAEVAAVTPAQYLDNSQTDADIYLVASDSGQVAQAFVEVRAPAKQLISSGGTATEQLSTDFDRQALLPPGQAGNPYTDRFYFNYDRFTDVGMYEVFYYVVDAESGRVSSPQRSRVYRDKLSNQAPLDFDLISPVAGDTVKTVALFDWQSSSDADGDQVTYILEIADDTSFTRFNDKSGVYHQEGIETTSAVIDSTGGLKDAAHYVWRVLAVDAYGKRTESSQYGAFATNNNNAPFGVVQGVAYDSQQYTGLDNGLITITVGSETQTVTPKSNGFFLAVVPPGKATISVVSEGYFETTISDLEVEVSTNSQPRVLVNLEVASTAAPTDSDGDGVPDSLDAFPQDPTESADGDGDGVGDNADAFPYDPAETLDSDQDGLGDNYELAHGLDINSSDSDGDGISDFIEIQQGTDPGDRNDPVAISNLSVIALHDMTGDGIAEVGQFGVLGDGTDTPQLVIIDPVTNTAIDTYAWPADWNSPRLYKIADRNNDEVDELALFGKRKDDGRIQVAIKSGATGAGMGSWSWPDSWHSPRFVELKDMTGDGLSEYAIFGRYAANDVPQLVVRDGTSKAEIARYKFTSAWANEKVMQWDDMTYDGITEIVMFGEHRSNGKTFLYVLDGNVPDLKLSQYNWPNKWANPSFHLLPDLDGDGIREPAVFGVNLDDGRPQLQVKKGDTKTGVFAIFNWLSTFSDVQFYQLSDQNADGVQDFGVLAYNSANGKRQLMVKNAMDRTQTLANYIWPDNWDNTRVVELDDLTGDGLPELGLIGNNRNTGLVQLQVKDRATRGLLNTYSWAASDVNAATVINTGDVDGDGTPDIGVYSVENGEGALEIFSGADASNQLGLIVWSTN